MATLEIRLSKKRASYLKSHLEEEHPKLTKGKMKIKK